MFISLILISLLSSGGSKSSPVCKEKSKTEDIDIQSLKEYLDEETGKRVENWNPDSGTNPAELGGYFEGDIIFPTKSLSRNGVRFAQQKWPNATVPYVIQGPFDKNATNQIMEAMNQYHKHTCIRFVERKSTDRDYIVITNFRSGCFSMVGKVGRYQQVNLQSPACTYYLGSILHELMHAVGFYHEHTRPDRDNYVTIHLENVKEYAIPNFEKQRNGTTDLFGLPYDYRSVMHYSQYAFSKNKKPTVDPKDTDAAEYMGKANEFSESDIKELNAMYNC